MSEEKKASIDQEKVAPVDTGYITDDRDEHRIVAIGSMRDTYSDGYKLISVHFDENSTTVYDTACSTYESDTIIRFVILNDANLEKIYLARKKYLEDKAMEKQERAEKAWNYQRPKPDDFDPFLNVDKLP